MKAHFQKLLNYNHWANSRFLECLLNHPLKNQRAYLLFSHLLTAEEVWLCRLLGAEAPIQRLWQQYPTASLSQMMSINSRGWDASLASYQDVDFLKEIAYKNSKGNSFSTPLAGIITHMVNHGTHHRGQISVLMRQEEVQPPESDYITYLRLRDTKAVA